MSDLSPQAPKPPWERANSAAVSALLGIAAVFATATAAPILSGQTPSSPDPNTAATGAASRAMAVQPPPLQEPLPKRLFGIIPNYRSHPSLKDSRPLSVGEKFRIASRDSFDPGTFLLAGTFAGYGLALNSSPSYGHGIGGFGRYYGSSFGNFVIGNFMTEGVLPSLAHQDPRYFRRGSGGWSRLTYAMGQIFITHGDNRRTQFNVSEVGGNAAAVAISNAYNFDNRTALDAAESLGIQLGIDMAGNVLKEFGPDLYRKVARKKHAPSVSGPRP